MTQQPQQSPQQPLTLEQRLRITNALAHYPALTLLVVMRRDVGFRTLSPLDLTVVTAVILLISSAVDAQHRPQDLRVFAMLTLSLGLFQRYLRWTEFKQGKLQHSREIGTSPFEFAFMPQFLLQNRRLGRYADPIVALLVGIALLRVSPALGAWICFSALCLRLNEFVTYRTYIQKTLDIGDSMSMSEIHSHIVDGLSGKADVAGKKTQAQGIPTGIGPDIQRKPKDGKATQTAVSKPQVEIGLWNLIKAKPKLTRANVILAFLVAIIADSLYFVAHYILGWLSNYFPGLDSFGQMLEFGVNCVAMTATIILLGFHWALVPSIFVPFLPVKFRIPTWTGCVAFVVWQRRKDSTPVEEQAAGNAAGPASPTPQQRMQDLNECRRKGWITEEEFETKRRQILEEI